MEYIINDTKYTDCRFLAKIEFTDYSKMPLCQTHICGGKNLNNLITAVVNFSTMKRKSNTTVTIKEMSIEYFNETTIHRYIIPEEEAFEIFSFFI